MQVVAVLGQPAAAVRRSVGEFGLTFPVLVDESREVIKTYGVWHRFGPTAWNIARPALFVIDRDAIIRYGFVATRQDEFPSHEEISRALDELHPH